MSTRLSWTRPSGSLQPSLPKQQQEPSEPSRTRRKLASSAPASPRLLPPRPPAVGSLAESRAQAGGLLQRLKELEARVASHAQLEEELKSVNLALMDRLAAFHSTNEANVRQAEEELRRMHASLLASQQAQARAEAEAEEARGRWEESQGALRAERLARRREGAEIARLQQLSDESARGELNRQHACRLSHLARAAQQRKYLMLLRTRTWRQASIRRQLSQRALLSREGIAWSPRGLARRVLAAWKRHRRCSLLSLRFLRRQARAWASLCLRRLHLWMRAARLSRRSLSSARHAGQAFVFAAIHSHSLALRRQRLGEAALRRRVGRALLCWVLRGWRGGVESEAQRGEALLLVAESAMPKVKRGGAMARWRSTAARLATIEAVLITVWRKSSAFRLMVAMRRLRSFWRGRAIALHLGKEWRVHRRKQAFEGWLRFQSFAVRTRRLRALALGSTLHVRCPRVLWLWRSASARLSRAGKKRSRARAHRARQLLDRHWASWMSAVMEGRDVRGKKSQLALRAVNEAFTQWVIHIRELALNRGRWVRAVKAGTSVGWRRGVQALKGVAAALLTSQLAALASRRYRQRTRIALQAVFIIRWLQFCLLEAKRGQTRLAKEKDTQIHLLMQARLANAAADRTTELALNRGSSLERDMQSLQAVLAEHRTQAEDAARALSATEARLDEMEAKLQGASEAQRDAETLRDQARVHCVSLQEDLDKARLARTVDSQQYEKQLSELQAALSERDQLLEKSQAALTHTSSELHQTAADRGSKLRSAYEVATSLRSMLQHKESELKSARAKERRLIESNKKADADASKCRERLHLAEQEKLKALGELQTARATVDQHEAKVQALHLTLKETNTALQDAHVELDVLRERTGWPAGSARAGDGVADPATNALMDPTTTRSGLNAADAMAQIRGLQAELMKRRVPSPSAERRGTSPSSGIPSSSHSRSREPSSTTSCAPAIRTKPESRGSKRHKPAQRLNIDRSDSSESGSATSARRSPSSERSASLPSTAHNPAPSKVGSTQQAEARSIRRGELHAAGARAAAKAALPRRAARGAEDAPSISDASSSGAGFMADSDSLCQRLASMCSELGISPCSPPAPEAGLVCKPSACGSFPHRPISANHPISSLGAPHPFAGDGGEIGPTIGGLGGEAASEPTRQTHHIGASSIASARLSAGLGAGFENAHETTTSRMHSHGGEKHGALDEALEEARRASSELDALSCALDQQANAFVRKRDELSRIFTDEAEALPPPPPPPPPPDSAADLTHRAAFSPAPSGPDSFLRPILAFSHSGPLRSGVSQQYGAQAYPTHLSRSSPARSDGWHEEDFNATSFSCLSQARMRATVPGAEPHQQQDVCRNLYTRDLPLEPVVQGSSLMARKQSQACGVHEGSSCSQCGWPTSAVMSAPLGAQQQEAVHPTSLDERDWMAPTSEVSSAKERPFETRPPLLGSEQASIEPREDVFSATDEVLLEGLDFEPASEIGVGTIEAVDNPRQQNSDVRQAGAHDCTNSINEDMMGDIAKSTRPNDQAEHDAAKSKSDRAGDTRAGDDDGDTQFSSPIAKSLHDRVRRLQARLGIQ